MKTRLLFIAICFALLPVGACKKATEKAVEQGVKQTTGTTSEESALNEKMDAYVGAINFVSAGISRGYESYCRWCPQAGPTGKELQPRYDNVSNPKDYLDKVKKATESDPKLAPIDEIATRYLVAVQELLPKIEEASKYYSQENYTDDKFEKGKQMHTGLVESQKAFFKVDGELRAAYDALSDQQFEKRLADVKAHNEELRYRTMLCNQQAKKTLKVIMDEYDKAKTPENIAIEPVKTTIDKFEATLEEVKSYVKANPTAPKTEFVNSGETGMGSYTDACDEFLKAGKSLYRKVRDKEKFESRNPSGDEGTPEYAIERYNRLIQKSNNELR
jgi:hypothetical protein